MVNRVSFCSLQTHLITNPSPLALSKAIKNEVEIEGMKQAHVSNIYMRYWPNGRLRWLHTGQVNFFFFFFFCVVLEQDEVEVNKNAKKSEAILTNQTWSIKNLSCIWSKRELFLRDQCGKSRTGARWSLLARSVSQSIFLPDRRFSHMINIDSIPLLLHVKQFQLKYCKNNSPHRTGNEGHLFSGRQASAVFRPLVLSKEWLNSF